MYEVLKPLFPDGPTNRTDPIVRHKSGYSGSPVTTPFEPERDFNGGGMIAETNETVLNNAIYYPIIRVNNHLILEHMLVEFHLYNDKFAPYIDLIFDDPENIIQFSDMPGLDNVITVVMMEHVVNASEPIKMDFYITDCKMSGTTFYIQAEFKLLELEKEQFLQDVFRWPIPGCAARWCQLPPNEHPTTYEYLHEIAEKCGLGFSATQKCRSIKDDRWRIAKHQKYKDLMKEAVQNGGLNEHSYFDCWIDPWGTVVMVNIAWVWDEIVRPDELATNVTSGVETADKHTESAKQSAGLAHRILSNASIATGYNNMMIKEFKKLPALDVPYYEGTLTKYHYMNLTGRNDQEEPNRMKKIEVQTVEDSLEGKEDPTKYEFQAQEFSGFEMGMLHDTIKQRRERNEWFKKHRANMFKITMLEPNFRLERGMLCMVLLFTNDTKEKSIIMSRRPNLHRDESGEPQKRIDLGEDAAIEDQYAMVMDVANSGQYYIDGTEWSYDQHTNKLVQHLYLFKKTPITEYYDRTQINRYIKKTGQ